MKRVLCLCLLPVSALAGVTIATTTSAVANMASVKSRIASLLMQLSLLWLNVSVA
jgi:hypothetical protein